MKKQSLSNGVISIVASMLLFSCSNNDATKSDANMVAPYNTGEASGHASTDSLTNKKQPVSFKDSITDKEKEETEVKEGNEK